MESGIDLEIMEAQLKEFEGSLEGLAGKNPSELTPAQVLQQTLVGRTIFVSGFGLPHLRPVVYPVVAVTQSLRTAGAAARTSSESAPVKMTRHVLV